MERRHRLHANEIPEVIKGLRLRLWYHLRSREDLPGATIAFRAYYRLSTHCQGRPSYPKPITWDLVKSYVNGTISPVDQPIETLQAETRKGA